MLRCANNLGEMEGLECGKRQGDITCSLCHDFLHSVNSTCKWWVPAAEQPELSIIYCRIGNNLYFLSVLGEELNPLKYKVIVMFKVIAFFFVQSVYTH